MTPPLHKFFTLLTQTKQYYSTNTNHYDQFHDIHKGFITNTLNQNKLTQTLMGQWQQLRHSVTTEYIWLFKDNQLILEKQVANELNTSIIGIFKDLGKSDFIYHCGDDIYQASIHLVANKSILKWDIQGPKKDVNIHIEMF